MKKLLIAFVLLFSAVAFTPSTEAASTVKVHYINVGQGDAILIQAGTQNILIDGGGKGKGDDIIAYLKKQKVTSLTAVVSTHPDADHIGGLAYIIRNMPVNSVYAPKVSHTTQAYKDFLLAVKAKKLTIKTATKGLAIPLKDKTIALKFIAPIKDYKKDLNNWSAVLHLKHNKKTFLFTGDAETLAEKDMLANKVLTDVDVLKVGHHGAKETTSVAFLNVVKPEYSIISVGKNSYGHPSSPVLTRLKNAKSKVYRTDKNGNIVFTSTGTKITVKVDKN